MSYNLVGGFKYVLFSSLFGEMIQFDEHIFQLGWFNHQPDNLSCRFFTPGVGPNSFESKKNKRHFFLFSPHRLVPNFFSASTENPFEKSCQVFSGLTNMLTGPIVNQAVAKYDFTPLLVEAKGRDG